MNAPAESGRDARGTPPHEIEFAEGPDATGREEGWPRSVGIGVLAVLVAAGLSGLLGGGGPLGTVTAEAPPPTAEAPPLRVTAERVARRDAPTTLRIEAGPGAATEGRLRLRLDRAFLDHVRVMGAEPPPLATEILRDGAWSMVFAASQGGGPVPVTLRVRHQDAFRLVPVRIALDGGDGAAAGGVAAVAFRQLVLP
jgi:hypothetical protein